MFEGYELSMDDKCMISADNDNENYDGFRDKVLVVIGYGETGDRGFDETMEGQRLYSFETEDGEDVPFSLYDYEIQPL